MRKRPLWEQRVLIAVSKGNKKIARRLQKETANWLTWGSLTHLRSELRKSTYTYWISLIYGQSVTHTLLLLNRNWCVREPQRACRTTHMFNTLQRGFEAWNGTLWVGYRKPYGMQEIWQCSWGLLGAWATEAIVVIGLQSFDFDRIFSWFTLCNVGAWEADLPWSVAPTNDHVVFL